MEQNNNTNGNNPKLTSNTNYWVIAVIAIIVVVALAVAIPHLKHSTTPAPDTSTAMIDTGTQTPAVSGTSMAMTDWNNMFQKYAGKLVVFGSDCIATPNSQILDKGTTILLMNNSTVPHTISVGNDKYALGALHYKTVTLGTTGTVGISCDAHTGVASIIVR